MIVLIVIVVIIKRRKRNRILQQISASQAAVGSIGTSASQQRQQQGRQPFSIPQYASSAPLGGPVVSTLNEPSNPITTQPMPSDGTLVEAPPPAYDLQDDYATFDENNKPACSPPPYQSTTTPSSPPLYSTSVFTYHHIDRGDNIQLDTVPGPDPQPDLSHSPQTDSSYTLQT